MAKFNSHLKKFQSRLSKLNTYIDIAFFCIIVILVVLAIIVAQIGTAFYYERHASDGPSAILSLYGLNQWDWLAIIIAFISLAFAALTFYSQRRTERNTMKIQPESQRSLLIEYSRHFYANLIVICAIEAKLAGRFTSFYPSEEHFLKMKVDLNSLDTGIFNNHIRNFSNLNQLQVKMRNFNEEIDVVIRHFTQQHLTSEAKERDLNTLKFKMGYLTSEVIRTLDLLWPGERKKHSDKMLKYVEEHAKKRNKDEERLLSEGERYFKNNQYFYPYENNESELIDAIFFRDEDIHGKKKEYDPATIAHINKFIHRLNLNIYAEIYGRNSTGSEKIFLIPFPD